MAGYAELHCHSHFSFLDGASAPDDLVARAVELGMPSLGITDHQGLYGAVRFSTAAEAAGLHPVLGVEIELLDAGVPDPAGIVVPASRVWRPGRRPRVRPEPPLVADGRPQRPRAERARLPAIAGSSRRTTAASASRSAGRISCCSPVTRPAGGRCAASCRGRTSRGRRPCRGSPTSCWRRTTRGWSRCPAAATASSRGGCGRVTGRARGRSRSGTRRCSGSASRRRRRASCSSWGITSWPTTTGSPRRRHGWPTSWDCRSW